VALSVTMTAISTVLAVMITPILTSMLVGERLDVNALGLFISTVKVVLVPVGTGLILNTYLPDIGVNSLCLTIALSFDKVKELTLKNTLNNLAFRDLVFLFMHPKPHLTLYISMYPDIQITFHNIRKQLLHIIYNKAKKLIIFNFVT
jgi:hypothetical protein